MNLTFCLSFFLFKVMHIYQYHRIILCFRIVVHISLTKLQLILTRFFIYFLIFLIAGYLHLIHHHPLYSPPLHLLHSLTLLFPVSLLYLMLVILKAIDYLTLCYLFLSSFQHSCSYC